MRLRRALPVARYYGLNVPRRGRNQYFTVNVEYVFKEPGYEGKRKGHGYRHSRLEKGSVFKDFKRFHHITRPKDGTTGEEWRRGRGRG